MFGIFEKKVPEAPAITNEKQYIEWYARYSDKVAYLRNLKQFRGYTDQLIAEVTKEALIMLNDYPNADVLFERVLELSSSYEKIKPIVERQGGLDNLSREDRGAIVSVLWNIAIGLEILKKKYKHKQTVELLRIVD